MCNITIYKGFEHRTYVKNIYDVQDLDGEIRLAITDDFYYPQYNQAAMCIDEITTRMEEYLDNKYKDDVVDVRFDNNSSLMGYPNNIMAFCSRRGQGKTSAMLAIMKALKDKDLKDSKKGAELFWNEAHRLNSDRLNLCATQKDKSLVLDKRFYVFATIDPTTMEVHDTVLNIILARMTVKARAVYQSRQKEGRGDNDLPCYRNVMKKIHETVRKIDSIKHKHVLGDIDELERISETDDNRSTKFAFRELVQEFLRYIDYDVLVISVDDADMAPDRSYEITEDLRKYCVVPQVVIMMAVHLATLKNCVEQHFIDTYKLLLDTKYATDHMPKYACRNIAQRYIDKMLPDIHQIHMHYIEEKIEEGKEVILYYLDAEDKNVLPDVNGASDYVGVLARLIYDKTGVVLLDTNYWLHNFMPKRMRELTHMLSYFTKMDDIDDKDRNYDLVNLMLYKFYDVNPNSLFENVSFDPVVADKCIKNRMENLDKLEDYFFEHWCPVNLSKRLCNEMVQLRTAPLESKNRRALEIMRSYGEAGDEITNSERAKGEFKYEPSSYTYADVLIESKRLRDNVKSPFKYDLRYAIVMYYTICMNKILSKSLFYNDCSILNELKTLTQSQISCDMGYGFYVDLSKLDLHITEVTGEEYNKYIREIKKCLMPIGDSEANYNDVSTIKRLSKIELDIWKSDGSSLMSQHVKTARFDYGSVMFGIIDEVVKVIKEYQKKKLKSIEEKKNALMATTNDDFNRLLGGAVACLYICNNDIRYTLRKMYYGKRIMKPGGLSALALLAELFGFIPLADNDYKQYKLPIKNQDDNEQDERIWRNLIDIIEGNRKGVEHHLDIYKSYKPIDSNLSTPRYTAYISTYVMQIKSLEHIRLLVDCSNTKNESEPMVENVGSKRQSQNRKKDRKNK